MCRELELVKCENVVAVDGGGIRILQEGAKMIACAGEVCWIWRGVEGVLPCAVVMQVGAEGFVCGLSQSVGGEVEGDGEVLVLLNGGTKPLLAVLGEIVVGQEWHCQWKIWFWRCEVAVELCCGRVLPGSRPCAGLHRLQGPCGGRFVALWLLQRRLLCVW